MSHIDAAKMQAQAISAAINGSSSAVQTLGSMGTDPHPERLLAVGLAHTVNTFGALISAIEELQREVDELKRRR